MAQDTVPALVELLKDPDKDVRREAASALGRLGRAAQAAVPAPVRAASGTGGGH